MKLRALVVIAAFACTAACVDFDATYRDCVARGACPGGLNPTGGGAGGGAPSGGVLAVEPSPADLRTVAGETLTTTFTIRNVGALTVRQVAIADPTESHFVKKATACSGSELAPDASCEVDIELSILADAGVVTGLFRVNSADAPTVEVPLSGRAVPRLTAEPTALDFGAVNLLDESLPRTVVVTNNSPLVTSGTLSFRTNAQYRAAPGTCSALAPRESCTAEVSYRPTTADGGATLTIQGLRPDGGSIADQQAIVALTGFGYPSANLAFVPSSVFVVGPPNVPTSRSLSLTNLSPFERSGPFTLSLLDDAGVFSLDAGECSSGDLDPGASCSVEVGITGSSTLSVIFGAKLLATMADGGLRFADVAGGAFELVPLTVRVNGDAGFVDSVNDAGAGPLTCAAPDVCTAWVPRGLPLVLRANDQPPNGIFSGWTSPCSSANPSCTVRPTSDAGISTSVQFEPQINTLTILFPTPKKEGVITLFPTPAWAGPGLTCDTNSVQTCTGQFYYFRQVTLFVRGDNGATLGALGAACDGGVDCTLSMAVPRSASVTWRSSDTNLAFVSSANWTPFGGRDSADQLCLADAMDAGLPGTRWVAWLGSADAGAPVNRLATNLGWQRPDGRVIALNRAALNLNELRNTLSVTARGGTATSANVFTGTTGDGGLGATCADWTSDAGLATIGGTSRGGPGWTDTGTSTCATTTARVYCFEDESTRGPPVVQRPPPASRLVFTSVATRDGLASDAELDQLCEAEASAAGLTPTGFSPYRTREDGGASVGRFDLTGPGYYRVDGVRVADPASTLGTQIPEQALVLSATGATVTGCQWRTGCNNWSTNSAAVTGTVHDATLTTWGTSTLSCDQFCHLICVQR